MYQGHVDPPKRGVDAILMYMYMCHYWGTFIVLMAERNGIVYTYNLLSYPFQAEQYALATAVTPAYHPHAPGEAVTSDDEKEDRTLVDADPEQAKAAHAQTKFTWV